MQFAVFNVKKGIHTMDETKEYPYVRVIDKIEEYRTLLDALDNQNLDVDRATALQILQLRVQIDQLVLMDTYLTRIADVEDWLGKIMSALDIQFNLGWFHERK